MNSLAIFFDSFKCLSDNEKGRMKAFLSCTALSRIFSWCFMYDIRLSIADRNGESAVL